MKTNRIIALLLVLALLLSLSPAAVAEDVELYAPEVETEVPEQGEFDLLGADQLEYELAVPGLGGYVIANEGGDDLGLVVENRDYEYDLISIDTIVLPDDLVGLLSDLLDESLDIIVDPETEEWIGLDFNHDTVIDVHIEGGQTEDEPIEYIWYANRAAGADQLAQGSYTYAVNNDGYGIVTFHFSDIKPVWAWAEDCSSATATFAEAEGGSQTLTATIGDPVLNQPTCDEPGTNTYTATVTYQGKAYTSKKILVAPATEHQFGAEWDWNDDFTAASATLTCEKCFDTLTLEATVTTETIPASCEEDGKIKHTATVALNGGTWTDVQTEETDDPATGHSYFQRPTWKWATDFSSATASFPCTKCDASMAVSATIHLTEETAPTCTVAGSKEYTASATFLGLSYSDRRTVAGGNATGHTYGEPVWTWSEDYKTATATFPCLKGDYRHPVTTTDISIQDDATDGKRYTASVTFDGKTYANTISQRKHKVTVSYVDGDGNKLAEPCVKEVPEGSGFSIVSPTLTHLVPDRAVVDGTMDTQDIAVTVTYSDNDCVITYIYNYKGKKDAKYQTVWCGEETQLLAFPFNLSKIKNERYMGWNTKMDGSGTAYADGAKITPMGDITLYAQWSTLYKITFYGNGGSGSNTTVKAVAGEVVELPECTYTKDGWTFIGWSTNKNPSKAKIYAEGAKLVMPAKNLKLYALWKGKKATIFFYKGSGKGKMSKITAAVGDKVKLPKCTYTYGNHPFLCWTTAKDGSGTAYANGAEIVVGGTRVQLFAQWKGLEVTVKFSGGSGRMEPITVTTGSTITLPACGFKPKKGQAFTGWMDTSETVHVPGDKIKVRNKMTLKAVWTKQGKISFIRNNGKGKMEVQYGLPGETIKLNANTFTRDGYEFAGWNTKKDGSGSSYKDKASIRIQSDKETKLYAQWRYVGVLNVELTSLKTISKSGEVALEATVTRDGEPVQSVDVQFKFASVGKVAKTTKKGKAKFKVPKSTLKALEVGSKVVYSVTCGSKTVVYKATVTP